TGTFVLYHPLQFPAFVKAVTTSDVIDFPRTIAHLFPALREEKKAPFISDLPQIRFPDMPWFSVIDTTHTIVSIGSIVSQTRTDPLHVTSFFKRQKKKFESSLFGILLYTTEIPFELIIDTDPKKQLFIVS